MCALLISVFTLSGAANRSFRTEVEQWNPIGFTQAQSGPQTTYRLTAGSAILPTVATAAPSGVLRGGSTNVITFTTEKEVGEKIWLCMGYSGDTPTLSGATGTPEYGKSITYTLTSQTVTITGDVTYFDCSKNQLTTLDIYKNTKLTNLICWRNKLTELDVYKNTALIRLDCADNQLTALDVSKNTALTGLDCSENQLTTLDVSKNTALTNIDCFGNQIKGKEMTRLVNSLPDRTGKTAGTFTVAQGPDLEGNICLKSDVAIAKGKNWNTLKYKSDTNENIAYEGDNVITFKTAKAVGETVELLMTYTGAAPILSGATGTHKSGVYVTYKLTSQTVTIRGDVTFLGCSSNQLTALDVSKNTVLEKLYCYNNQLTALDVSKNTALTMLWCFTNRLTALDVSKNTALTALYCHNNQLKALDVSKNTKLGTLNCRGNQIKGEEMTRLVNSLPDRTGKKAGEFTVVQEPAPEGNICLKSDVAIAKSKNWNTYKYKTNTEKYVAYEGSHYIMFTTAKAVGEEISLYMRYSGAAPTLSGATGTPENEKRITYTLTSQTVTITGDVTFFDCSKNQLTTLDVSQNTALIGFNCSDNQLTALDLSQNTAMTRLDCYNNQLKALDVSQNTALTMLFCSNNQLKALDVSPNTALTMLFCSNNQLTALDVSKNTALIGLNCSNNQLTALDVSKNTALTVLVCFGNQIKGEEMTRLVNSLPVRTGKYVGTFTVVQEPSPEGNICLKSDVAIAKGKNWNTIKYKSDTEEYVPYEGAQPLKVTLTKEGEGTLTATGAADLNAVPLGTELTIEATPAAGYELKALTANGTDILATKKVVVKGATEVKATFAKKTTADVVNGSSLRLYPNPASTYVNVKGAKADALVRLYDANGSLRYEARTDADGTLQIDLSAYAEGTYLLRVGNDAQRLLIQR